MGCLMLKLHLEGIGEAEQYIRTLIREFPVETAKGLNDTAFYVRKKQIEMVGRIFPTAKPQTKRNFFVQQATVDRLVATIWFDQIYRRGFEEYMLPNIKGGSRKMKPSEQRLGRFYVPGAGAQIDQYGNMKGGQITQILSQMGRFGDVAGYDMNQTARSKRRRGRTTKSTEYFIVTKKTGGLAPGIYQRHSGMGPFQDGASPLIKSSRSLPAGSFQRGKSGGAIRSRGITPVMIFTKAAPKYKAVWPFYEVAKDIGDKKLVPNILRRIDYVLRKTR